MKGFRIDLLIILMLDSDECTSVSSCNDFATLYQVTLKQTLKRISFNMRKVQYTNHLLGVCCV